MARVEIPAPGDLVIDSQGNVLSGRAVTLKLATTSTDATHYSALTAGTSATGGLQTASDGTIVNGSGNRRYIDEGSYDLTIASRSRRIEASLGLTGGGVGYNVRAYWNAAHADDTQSFIDADADAPADTAIVVPYKASGYNVQKTGTTFSAAISSTVAGRRWVGVGRPTLNLLNTTADGTAILQLAAADQTVEGIVFNAGAAIAAALTAYDVKLRSSSTVGIATRAKVERCWFPNSATAHVFYGGGDSTLTGTKVHDNVMTGLGYGVLANTTAGTTIVDGFKVADNTFLGVAASTGNSDAVEFNGPTNGSLRNITVSDNFIRDFINSGSSAGMGIGAANVIGLNITGNTVIGCSLDGIHVEDRSEDVTVTGNTVRDCFRSGISVQAVTPVTWGDDANASMLGITITGNTVERCNLTKPGFGIEAVRTSGAAGLLRAVSVTGNTVRDNGASGIATSGMCLGGAEGFTCTGNTVTNSQGDTTWGPSGIVLNDGCTGTVTGNTCTDDLLVIRRLGAQTALPAATITLDTTDGFAASGTVIIGGQSVTYTGKTATTLTGATGGTGTENLGVQVRQTRTAWQQYGIFTGGANVPGVCSVEANHLEGNAVGRYGGTGWTNVVINRAVVEALSLITVGEESLPRLLASTSVGMTSGTLRFSYFTARRGESVGSLRFVTGTTAAGATPTLVRYGLYTVAANGDLTLVASTVNDTTLFAAASTGYTKALSVAYAKQAGVRYAVGVIVVTAATVPTLACGFQPTSEAGIAPRTASSLTGQTDLPSSIAAGTLVNLSSPPYGVLL